MSVSDIVLVKNTEEGKHFKKKDQANQFEVLPFQFSGSGETPSLPWTQMEVPHDVFFSYLPYLEISLTAEFVRKCICNVRLANIKNGDGATQQTFSIRIPVGQGDKKADIIFTVAASSNEKDYEFRLTVQQTPEESEENKTKRGLLRDYTKRLYNPDTEFEDIKKYIQNWRELNVEKPDRDILRSTLYSNDQFYNAMYNLITTKFKTPALPSQPFVLDNPEDNEVRARVQSTQAFEVIQPRLKSNVRTTHFEKVIYEDWIAWLPWFRDKITDQTNTMFSIDLNNETRNQTKHTTAVWSVHKRFSSFSLVFNIQKAFEVTMTGEIKTDLMVSFSICMEHVKTETERVNELNTMPVFEFDKRNMLCIQGFYVAWDNILKTVKDNMDIEDACDAVGTALVPVIDEEDRMRQQQEKEQSGIQVAPRITRTFVSTFPQVTYKRKDWSKSETVKEKMLIDLTVLTIPDRYVTNTEFAFSHKQLAFMAPQVAKYLDPAWEYMLHVLKTEKNEKKKCKITECKVKVTAKSPKKKEDDYIFEITMLSDRISVDFLQSSSAAEHTTETFPFSDPKAGTKIAGHLLGKARLIKDAFTPSVLDVLTQSSQNQQEQISPVRVVDKWDEYIQDVVYDYDSDDTANYQGSYLSGTRAASDEAYDSKFVPQIQFEQGETVIQLKQNYVKFEDVAHSIELHPAHMPRLFPDWGHLFNQLPQYTMSVNMQLPGTYGVEGREVVLQNESSLGGQQIEYLYTVISRAHGKKLRMQFTVPGKYIMLSGTSNHKCIKYQVHYEQDTESSPNVVETSEKFTCTDRDTFYAALREYIYLARLLCYRGDEALVMQHIQDRYIYYFGISTRVPGRDISNLNEHDSITVMPSTTQDTMEMQDFEDEDNYELFKPNNGSKQNEDDFPLFGQK